MSLTYQPFASVPEIQALGKDLNKNVGEGERLACIMGAVGSFFQARRTHGWARLALYATTASLLYRGVTGHCELYRRTGISTR